MGGVLRSGCDGDPVPRAEVSRLQSKLKATRQQRMRLQRKLHALEAQMACLKERLQLVQGSWGVLHAHRAWTSVWAATGAPNLQGQPEGEPDSHVAFWMPSVRPTTRLEPPASFRT